jgi:hypothetical protein
LIVNVTWSVPTAVALVASRILLVSRLVTVTCRMPAGAGTPSEPLVLDLQVFADGLV